MNTKNSLLCKIGGSYIFANIISESARKLGKRMAIEMNALQSSKCKWSTIASYMHPPREYEYCLPEHGPNAQSNEIVYSFFEYFLE